MKINPGTLITALPSFDSAESDDDDDDEAAAPAPALMCAVGPLGSGRSEGGVVDEADLAPTRPLVAEPGRVVVVNGLIVAPVDAKRIGMNAWWVDTSVKLDATRTWQVVNDCR